jgi:RNA polymerase sigma-70 factor, ECF subfamily
MAIRMDPTVDGNDELATRLRRSDPEALAALLALHRPRLWRMVNFRMDRRLLGRTDPDDVLQEAYLAAAQRIAHFADDGFASPFVWLRMIVQQALIDVHRKHLGAQMRDAGREVSIFASSYPQSTSASLAIHLVGDATSPSVAAARGETLDTVQKAIETMDPLDQEVLALRHFEELTNTEVAEILRIQAKAASIRYVRALRRLKQLLGAAAGLAQEQGDGG